MSHHDHTGEERRNGAPDRRMRDRTPASDRRIESLGHVPQAAADRAESPPAVVDSQMLFERS